MPQAKETKHVFVSYRVSRKDLAVRMSDAAESVGWIADTIEEALNSPYPPGSVEESQWLTDAFAERIEPGCTFISLVSDDADKSQWILWEALEGFTKSYRVIVCWLSGSNPEKIVFPLPRYMYRFMDSPQAFIVDARKDPELAVTAVKRILSPSRRYRVLFRLQQVLTILVCIALTLLPGTVLLGTSVLSPALANPIRSALLRPWVCLFSLWLSVPLVGIFYPSYGGPARLAPDPIDKHVRLITPGFTGWKWNSLLVPLSFVVMCTVNGIGLFTLQSMTTIGWSVYIEAGILGWLLLMGYERVRRNVFSVHLGKILRKIVKYYGVTLEELTGYVAEGRRK
ncbi:MAG: hypothetical protein ACXW3C_05020 [Pyrinomonadaceae bacterium]